MNSVKGCKQSGMNSSAPNLGIQTVEVAVAKTELFVSN